jgi:4-amino-4-deoxy-L-arabinose transferase-like glycosyltransferase
VPDSGGMAPERTLTATRPDTSISGPPGRRTGAHRAADADGPAGDQVTDLADGRTRPRWALPALLVILAATAAAYLYNLSSSGYGNDFYAAAVQAGTKSWKAFLFGSLDSSNFITVDKPPAALWVMELSARIFGFNTWSVMVPNVVEGVAAVGLLYGAVRRVAGSGAGLAAAAVLAVTPVAALMFRFDNPDAFLVLLLVASAYCMTRALERAGTRWIVAAGALVGMAFLAKMLQAFTVVPAFGLVYLIAAPTTLRRRIVQLLLGGAALVAAGGWWVALVSLTPAADRPFVDGSPDNSILNLIFVYNGFGRLTGSGGGGGGGASFSGAAGVFRLFNDAMGGQASWLIPAALVAIVAGLVARHGQPRTDRVRAALILWGGWLLVTGAVFSYGKGIIHTYYTVALAPAIAALVAIGARQLWASRHHLWARLAAAVAVLGTGAWAWTLLDRTPSYDPALRVVVVVAAIGAAAGLLAAPWLRRTTAALVLCLALVAGLGAPVAYATTTVRSAHAGSIPSAGPASAGGGFGGFGGRSGSAGRSGLTGRGGSTGRGGLTGRGGFTGRGGAAGKGFPGGELPSGGFPGGTLPSGGFPGGSLPSGATRGGTSGRTFPSGFGGGAAGATFGGASTTSKALVTALQSDASTYRWVAATSGSSSAAGLELATGGDPVMAIGGFSGQGGNLSLKAFEAYVAKGDIHYYIAGGQGGPGRSGSASAITSWVKAHYTARTIGGETVYDLTARS